MKHVAVLAAALSFSACAAAPVTQLLVRGDGFATLGQPTRIGALMVTPRALIEDSRCPINARCLWAGRLVLKTRIEGAGWRETVDLTLGQTHSTHGTGLALVSAEPGKMAGAEASPPASLFSFEPR